MKTKFYALLILFISVNSFSQSLEKLKAKTTKFYDSHYLMEFEATADLTYPKVYENKDAFIEKLNAAYENDEYRLRLQLPTVQFLFGEIKKNNGKSFCFITFKNPVRYFFEEKLTATQTGEKTKWLEEKNNTKDVTFEPARNSFNVRKNTTYVAVYDENTSGEWKFFNFDDKEQREFFEKEFEKL